MSADGQIIAYISDTGMRVVRQLMRRFPRTSIEGLRDVLFGIVQWFNLQKVQLRGKMTQLDKLDNIINDTTTNLKLSVNNFFNLNLLDGQTKDFIQEIPEVQMFFGTLVEMVQSVDVKMEAKAVSKFVMAQTGSVGENIQKIERAISICNQLLEVLEEFMEQ